MSHGCELETSVLLALRPDLVDMTKAEKDISFPPSRWFYWDLEKPPPEVSPTPKLGVPAVPTSRSK